MSVTIIVISSPCISRFYVLNFTTGTKNIWRTLFFIIHRTRRRKWKSRMRQPLLLLSINLRPRGNDKVFCSLRYVLFIEHTFLKHPTPLTPSPRPSMKPVQAQTWCDIVHVFPISCRFAICRVYWLSGNLVIFIFEQLLFNCAHSVNNILHIFMQWVFHCCGWFQNKSLCTVAKFFCVSRWQ